MNNQEIKIIGDIANLELSPTLQDYLQEIFCRYGNILQSYGWDDPKQLNDKNFVSAIKEINLILKKGHNERN